MPSRFLSVIAAPVRRVTAEAVWALDTTHVFGARWGWDWVILEAGSSGALGHPAGRRWGWLREEAPQLCAGAWSLELWLGAFYVVLERMPRQTAKGRRELEAA